VLQILLGPLSSQPCKTGRHKQCSRTSARAQTKAERVRGHATKAAAHVLRDLRASRRAAAACGPCALVLISGADGLGEGRGGAHQGARPQT
jgi:hypothetical protein